MLEQRLPKAKISETQLVKIKSIKIFQQLPLLNLEVSIDVSV